MPHTQSDIKCFRDVRDRVATTPVLLVACDYDGTLSAITERAEDAKPHPPSMDALLRLAKLPHTHVAIVSGRPRSLLTTTFASIPRVELIGSHGAEFDGNLTPVVDPSVYEEKERIVESLKGIVRSVPGVRIEFKPKAVALHYRGASESAVSKTLDLVGSILRTVQYMTVRLGSMVVEFATDKSNKGIALEALRVRLGASAVVFIGDDLTDEHAFQVLGHRDAGVKVGKGETHAQFRVSGHEVVPELLQHLAQERETWLEQRTLTPLQSLSALSDLRTLGLVDGNANIVWLCLPRLDSPAMFSQLLGDSSNGHFSIEPVNQSDESSATPKQHHIGDTMVLRTQWPSISVTDYLDCSGGRAYQRAGRTDLIRVIEGTGTVQITFAPRLDFGRIPTKLTVLEHGLEVEGLPASVTLYSPGVRWTIKDQGRHQTALSELELTGKPVVLELRYGTPSSRDNPKSEHQRRESVAQFWSSWSASIRASGPHEQVLRKSALMLRSLCYGPTGAVAAAATTSLPEHLGGARNWDYRYCWPRDGAMACSALIRLGNTGTALRFLDWLAAVVEHCESPDCLRPVYTLLGDELGAEGEVGELSGYGGSKPVRISNAAAQQVQLDVFGPIVDLIASLAQLGAPLTAEHWSLVRAMVSAVETRWNEPDHGIWELRGPRNHHVHTKAMCYWTLDRAITLHKLDIGKDPVAWIALRERIREDVLQNGYNKEAKCFTTAYGSRDLDAASLLVGITGLIKPDDPRWIETVRAVHASLCTGSVVKRYLFADNLPGREGGFHICTSWLIESLLTLGEIDEAEKLLNGLIAHVGPTGTMTEMFDDHFRIALGNLPQAYSYIALINSVKAMERARSAT